jgi:2-polyprenyl-3-methyl-5-hydroxy-6-metoxy-1,4-benzoquinol methylase
VIRTLHPELLDTLPAHDASAIGSRRDLRRLNNLMGHSRVIARSLKQIFSNAPPSRMLEIGAGDGKLLLRIAQRLPANWRDMDVTFVDLQNLLSAETKIEFAVLNWQIRSVEADIFDWLSDPSTKTDVVLANLVLHHFTDAQLTLLFSEVAEKANAFVAVEPRRSRWPLLCANLLSLIGCNAVTCHDAPISVHAGFTGRELSALWPRSDEWELTEGRAGLFSHLFVARRKGS